MVISGRCNTQSTGSLIHCILGLAVDQRVKRLEEKSNSVKFRRVRYYVLEGAP